MHLPKNSKPSLAFKEGLLKLTKKRNTDAINDHAKSISHLNIIANLKEKAAKKQRTSIISYEQSEEAAKNNYLEVTSRMIRTVYIVNKLSLPFSDHKSLVLLQKMNGLHMGRHHYERTSCTLMTLHISKHMHDILIENLLKSEMPISLIVDDTTDVGNIHYKIVYFQTIEEVNPVIYFYKLVEMKSETGLAGFEGLRLAWESEEEKDFSDYIKNNLVGFASDGAPANTGRLTGTIKYLKDWAKNPIFAIHCMAHKLELAVKHAFDSMKNLPNMNKLNEYLDKTISKTYSFYNGYGHKRKTHLKQTCEKYNQKFYALNNIIPIRWVASDFNALTAIYRMWKALVHDLGEIGKDREFEDKTKIEATKRRRELIGKNFLIMFHFVYDILNELSIVSQNMQKREGLVVNAQNFKKNLDDMFNFLMTQNGHFLELFLENSQCESDYEPELLEPCRTVERYINANRIKYKDIDLINDSNEIPDISAYRTSLLTSLLSQMNVYFPDGSLSNFDVFDPKKFPEADNYVAMRTYGLNKIKELNIFFKINNDETIIVKEWQTLINEIVNHPNYCEMKSDKTSAMAFWAQALKWDQISWGLNIKRLLQIVLSIPISSAEAERGFSTLKYIRDTHRARLTPKNLDAMMRIKINGPDELHHFAAAKYAKSWINSGHYATDDKRGAQLEENIPYTVANDDDIEMKKKYLLKSTLF